MQTGTLEAQEGAFLREEEAPRALFPGADRLADTVVASTPELRQKILAELGRTRPTLWESAYRIFTVSRGNALLGHVVVVEEIGKHRPISFAVAVTPGGALHDLAVLTYREAYGGEVRQRRFLAQYRGKTLADSLLAYRDIRNIAGATLSVEATGRAARKAMAVLRAAGTLG